MQGSTPTWHQTFSIRMSDFTTSESMKSKGSLEWRVEQNKKNSIDLHWFVWYDLFVRSHTLVIPCICARSLACSSDPSDSSDNSDHDHASVRKGNYTIRLGKSLKRNRKYEMCEMSKLGKATSGAIEFCPPETWRRTSTCSENWAKKLVWQWHRLRCAHAEISEHLQLPTPTRNTLKQRVLQRVYRISKSREDIVYKKTLKGHQPLREKRQGLWDYLLTSHEYDPGEIIWVRSRGTAMVNFTRISRRWVAMPRQWGICVILWPAVEVGQSAT